MDNFHIDIGLHTGHTRTEVADSFKMDTTPGAYRLDSCKILLTNNPILHHYVVVCVCAVYNDSPMRNDPSEPAASLEVGVYDNRKPPAG